MAEKDERETEVQPDPVGAHNLVMRPCPGLMWTDDVGTHQRALESEQAVVGSRESVDLRLQAPSVSRLHAEFRTTNDELWVFDLGSKNGTFVDGVRVSGARVHDGATLRFGGIDMQVSLTDPPIVVDVWPHARYQQLVGGSTRMRELYAALDRVAKTTLPVLIEGETGTGKELAARALHASSDRARGPFVVVDCGALVESLLESELFGHEQGAFTGADHDRVGCIEAADGGTVFLDEIGEMPLDLQTKLLRVVEAQTIRRIGQTTERKVDVRFVSATHRNLRKMVNAGHFREDLYFRLAVVALRIPALRERTEDIPELAKALSKGRGQAHLTPDFLASLKTRPWLGNVRELRSFLARALAFGPHLAQEGFGAPPAIDREVASPGLMQLSFTDAREQAISEFEKDYLRNALDEHDGNVRDAAEAKGLSYGYFYSLMRKHAIASSS